jgi:thiosulfate/3-mercaptopyruvate sulfurtransferase
MLGKVFGRKNTLVSAKQAKELIEYCGDKIPLRILATTYTFPVIDKDRFEFFNTKRIPNSTYFDIDAVADLECGIPHTAPSISEFGKFMKDLDISKDDVLLLYDDYSILGSSRTWFMMKAFGFKGIFPYFSNLRCLCLRWRFS